MSRLFLSRNTEDGNAWTGRSWWGAQELAALQSAVRASGGVGGVGGGSGVGGGVGGGGRGGDGPAAHAGTEPDDGALDWEAASAHLAIAGESERLVVESPWSQFTSERQRF
eukprot:COSAG01_NODE_258_length_20077_cov_124.162429_21_plen_111_part_00